LGDPNIAQTLSTEGFVSEDLCQLNELTEPNHEPKCLNSNLAWDSHWIWVRRMADRCLQSSRTRSTRPPNRQCNSLFGV